MAPYQYSQAGGQDYNPSYSQTYTGGQATSFDQPHSGYEQPLSGSQKYATESGSAVPSDFNSQSNGTPIFL